MYYSIIYTKIGHWSWLDGNQFISEKEAANHARQMINEWQKDNENEIITWQIFKHYGRWIHF